MTPPTSLAIRLSRVSKRLGWTWALRNVDLEIERGTTTLLAGPNGAGKTTLLRVVATLLKPSAGAGEVLGHALGGGAEAIRRRTGFLTAHEHLYGDLSATENLRFARWMAGQRSDDEELARAVARVGLSRDAQRRAREYSSGMRKRLALALLLLRPLELVLLDEPYANLDADGIDLVDELMAGWRAAGLTVVIATHRTEGLSQVADRVVRLESGKVTYSGVPTDREPPPSAGAPPTEPRADG